MKTNEFVRKMVISLCLAMVTAFTTWVATVTDQFDFGMWAPAVGVLVTLSVNWLREMAKTIK